MSCYHSLHVILILGIDATNELLRKSALSQLLRLDIVEIAGKVPENSEQVNKDILSVRLEINGMKKIATSWLALLVIITLIALPACTTINPYTGEKQTSKATTGAAIGGVAGAILGAATASRGDRTKMALIGGGIGAIAGGGAGYYMDVQEAKLRQKLEGTGVRVVRDGNNIRLVMPGDITFETNSASLDSKFFEVLDSVATVLNEYKSTLVTVAGYTDSTGSADYNQKLSEQRASTVALYLNSRGVAKERLAAVGHGEANPVASNNTAEGRARNRRVEITLDPITK